MANEGSFWGLSMRTDGRYGGILGLGTRIAYENTYEPGVSPFGWDAAGIGPVPSTSTFTSGYGDNGGFEYGKQIWAAGETVPEMGGQGLRIGYPDFRGDTSLLSGGYVTQAPAPTTTKQSGGNTWGSIGVGLMIGAALGKAHSAYTASKIQASNYATQSWISADNAKLAQMGVEQAFRRGEAEIAQLTRKAALVKAQQRTAFAARGVALGTGNTAEVMASTDISKEADKMTVEANALAAAWGYRRKAIMSEAQSKAQAVMAKAYNRSAPWAAAASLLNTAAQVSGSYLKLSARV